jgi:hypothetical protein
MIGKGSVKSDPAPFHISDQELPTGLFQVFEAKRVSVEFWTSVIMPSPWMWIVPSRFTEELGLPDRIPIFLLPSSHQILQHSLFIVPCSKHGWRE